MTEAHKAVDFTAKEVTVADLAAYLCTKVGQPRSKALEAANTMA